MRYLQTCLDYAVDTETYKFVPVTSVPAEEIDMPLFSTAIDAVVMSSGKRVQIEPIKLNSLIMDIVIDGDVDALDTILTFHDRIKDEEVVINVHSVPLKSIPKMWQIGVEYRLTIDGKEQNEFLEVQRTQWGPPNFELIQELGFQKYDSFRDWYMSFGMPSTKFKVIYKGHELEGTTYAMLVDSWAVLLDDDLSFDAIAALNGAKSGFLDVEKFFYTTNKYILKVMMLLK